MYCPVLSPASVSERLPNPCFNPAFDIRVVPLAALAVSGDSTILFFIGLQFRSVFLNQPVAQLSAYDTTSLAELPWSPVKFGEFGPLDMAIAPDGSRLYVPWPMTFAGG